MNRFCRFLKTYNIFLINVERIGCCQMLGVLSGGQVAG